MSEAKTAIELLAEMGRAEMAEEASFRRPPDGEVKAMTRAVLRQASWPITADEEIARAERTAEKLRQKHWLLFAPADESGFRAVTGCMCGFAALDDDCGYGESVTVHLMRMAALDALDTLCEDLSSGGSDEKETE